MTVIAWDGKTLAADKRSTYGGMICTVTKIQKVNGLLVGGAGEASFIGAMFEWIKGGRVTAEFPTAQASKDDWQTVLVIELDGSNSLYERTPHPIRYEQSHIAIGSGREYARAALHLGCNAQEAVAVAVALDSGCGNGIDALTLGE